MGHDQQRQHDDVADEGEVLLGVVGQPRQDRGIDAERAGGAGGQRIAIRRGAGAGLERRGAGAATAILHHHAMRPAARELIGIETREDVGGLAGREGDDDADRLLRPG